MKLKTIPSLAVITLLPLSCIQKDKPITAELAELLHNRKLQGESMASRNNKAPAIFEILSNIKENPDNQRDSIDSLSQYKISPQDSIKKATNPVISSDKISDSLAAGSLTSPENTKETKQSLSQEITLPITSDKTLPSLEPRRDAIITDILKAQNNITLDTTLLKSEFKIIFEPYFIGDNNKIHFISPTSLQQETIAQSLGRVKNHIKDKNLTTWMRGKKDMQSYIQQYRLGIIYQTLVLDKNFIYTGGAQQFEKDVAELFRLYE